MLRRRRRTVEAIFSVFAMVFVVCGRADAEWTLPMPKGLENVYLGMSFEELRKVKPNLIRSRVLGSYGGDQGVVSLYFQEDLVNDFFSFASYKFSNDKLVEITLSEAGTPDFVRNRVLGLIKGCIKKWGGDFSKKIGVIKNHFITKQTHYYPIFYWERPQAKIMMDYVITVDKKFAPNWYDVVIFDPEMQPDEIWKYIRDPIDSTELEEVFKDLPLAETYKGPVFE